MTKNRGFSIIIVLLVVLVLFLPKAYSQTEFEEKVDYLNEELVEKQKKIDELYKDLDLYGELLQKLTDKKGGQVTTADNLVELKKEIASKNKQIDSLRISFGDLKKQMSASDKKYEQKIAKLKKEQNNGEKGTDEKIVSLNENIDLLISTSEALKAKLVEKVKIIETLRKDVTTNSREVIKKVEDVHIYENKTKNLEEKIQELVLAAESFTEQLFKKDSKIEGLKKEVDAALKKDAQEKSSTLLQQGKSEKLEIDIKELNSKINVLNKEVVQKDALIEKLQKSVDSLNTTKDNNVQTLAKAEQEVAKLKKDYKDANVLLGETKATLTLKEQKIIDMQEKLNDSVAMLGTFKNEIEQKKKEKKDAQNLSEKQLKKVNDEIAKKQKANDNLLKQIETSKEALKNTKNEYEAQNVEIVNAKKNANSMKAEMEKELRLLKVEIKTLKSDLAKIKDQASVLELEKKESNQQVSVLKVDAKTKEKTIALLSSEKKDYEKTITLLNTAKKENKETIEKLNSSTDVLKSSLNVTEKKLADTEKILADNESDHEKVKIKYEKNISSLEDDIKQKQSVVTSSKANIEQLNEHLLLTKDLLDNKKKEYAALGDEYKSKAKEFQEKIKALNKNIEGKQKDVDFLRKDLSETSGELKVTAKALKDQDLQYKALEKLHKKNIAENKKEIASLKSKIKKALKNIEKLETELKDKGNVIAAKTATVKTITHKNDLLQKSITKMSKAIEKNEDKIKELQRNLSVSKNKFSNKEKEYLDEIKKLGVIDKVNAQKVASFQKETEKYKEAVQTLLDGTYEDASVKQGKIVDLTGQLKEAKSNLSKERRLSISKSELLQEVEGKFNSDEKQQTNMINDLEGKIAGLKAETQSKVNTVEILQQENKILLEKLKEDEKEVSRKFAQLGQAMAIAQEKLQSGIDDYKIELELSDEGIEMTVLTDKLFNSGSAQINVEGQKILDDISEVLKTTVPNNKVEILGHTDNTPIKYSDWNSNWELSTARALSVLGYFVDNKSMLPNRFSVVGCGEYVPVANNTTKKGRKKNRRVDIVIQPL